MKLVGMRLTVQYCHFILTALPVGVYGQVTENYPHGIAPPSTTTLKQWIDLLTVESTLNNPSRINPFD
jgi:hypothetical protein